jgi:hypothetical protein
MSLGGPTTIHIEIQDNAQVVRVRRVFTIVCLAGVVIALTLMIQSPVVAQPETTAIVTLTESDSVMPGDRTTVAVQVDTTASVYGAEFNVRASSSDVRLTNLTQGNYLRQNGSSIVIVSRTNGSTGLYGETRVGTDSGVSGSGVLAEFDVTVPQSVTADAVDINLTSTKFVDPEAAPLPTQVTNVTVPINQSENTGDESPASTRTAEEANSDEATSTPSVELSDLINNSTATASAPPQSSWQEKITDRVTRQMQQPGRTSVVIQLRATGSLKPILNRINRTELEDMRVNTELRTVQARADMETIKSVAQINGVSRIRYSGSQQRQTVNQTATGSETDTSTASPAMITTQTGQAQSTETSPTDITSPGFGIVAGILAVLYVSIRARRH